MSTKNFTAQAAIPGYSIVKATGPNTDGYVAVAAASTDLIIGVSEDNAKNAGDRVDVFMGEDRYVIAGAPIQFGQRLTSDANGHAIPAAPAAGVNAQIVGVALQSASTGDLTRILVALSVMQG